MSEATERVRELVEDAAEKAIYLPVQRSNSAGYRFGADMVAAIPIPLWEQIVEAVDQLVEQEAR